MMMIIIFNHHYHHHYIVMCYCIIECNSTDTIFDLSLTDPAIAYKQVIMD